MKHHWLERCLISPPFGNYFEHPNATRVLGSFTTEKRPGLIWNTLKSFRPTSDGWVNKIGLRNCGVENVPVKPTAMYSCAALYQDDWGRFYEHLPDCISRIEVNMGCPNAGPMVEPSAAMWDLLHMVYDVVSVKLAPTDGGFAQGRRLVEECGVKTLHCCNTIPTERGGLSGDQVRWKTFAFVEMYRHLYPELTLIAGGGVYDKDAVDDYIAIGADHISLATAFMLPWRAKRLISYAADKYAHETPGTL